MTAPVVFSSATTNGTSSTSHAINIPASIAAGDLVICFVAYSSGSSTFTSVPSTDSPAWKRAAFFDNGLPHCAQILYRISDGANDKLRLIHSASVSIYTVVLRITLGNYLDGTYAKGLSTNSTHPAFTTAATGRDHLWLAARMGDGSVMPTVLPSGYTSIVNVNNTSTALAVAKKTGTNVESAGNWTVSSEDWITFTLAVYALPQLSGTVTAPDSDPATRELYLIDRDTNAPLVYHAGLNPLPQEPGLSGKDGTFSIAAPANTNGYSLIVRSQEAGYSDVLVSSLTPIYG